MKAWRVYAFGDMRLDEVPDPILRPGYVLVEVKVVQPSVTEVIRFHGRAARRTAQFKRLIDSGPAQVFGHEAAGRVLEVAPDVESLRPGDPVAIFSNKKTCGRCRFCRAGYQEGCLDKLAIGQHIPGCFAELAALPAECLVKLPDGVSFSEGATVQAMTSAFKSVLAADIRPGDVVAVLGQGAMGLASTQIAKAVGARMVIGTARRRRSIEMALHVGADVAVNAGDVDPVAAVLDLTGGIGVDVAIETAGGSTAEGLAGYETFFQAVRMVRPGGKVVVASSLVEPATLPDGFQMFQSTGISLVFDAGFQRDMREFLMDLIASKRLRLEPLITHTLDGIAAVPEAFEITGNKRRYNAINPAQVVIAGG